MRPVVARAIALSLTLAGFLACRQGDGPYEAPPDERRAEEAGPAADFVRRTMHFPSGDDDSSPLRVDHDAPREIWVGHPFTDVITVTNQSDDVLHGVLVRGRFSRGYRPSPEDGGKLLDGTATWDVGTLRAGESREIRLAGTAAEAGELTTCLEASFTPQLCTTRRAVVPNLEVALTAPAEVLICDPLVGELTVRNAGETPLRGVRVDAALPEGLRTDRGEASAAFNAGDLDPGESETRRIPLKAARPGSFPLKAVARAGPVAREASATTLVREPVLKIEQRAPAERFAGGDAALEIVVTNVSDTPSHDTVVEEAVSGGRLVGASDDGRASGSTATWSLGTLAPGASRTLSAALSAEDVGEVEAVARARGHCARAVEARTVTAFKGAPAVLLEVVDGPDPVVVGRRVAYTIRVTNQGRAVLTNIRIACGLEDSMERPTGEGPTAVRTGAATPARGLEFDALPSLEPRARSEWTVTVEAVQPADARFRVTMTCDQIARPVEESESTHFFK
jgi:hypothetical protein